jgi:hypothetical protein
MQKWSKGSLIHVKGLAFKPTLFEFLKNFHLRFFEILKRSKNLFVLTFWEKME